MGKKIQIITFNHSYINTNDSDCLFVDILKLSFIQFPSNINVSDILIKKFISRQPIFLTDAEYYYILEEIGCRDKIEFKI